MLRWVFIFRFLSVLPHKKSIKISVRTPYPGPKGPLLAGRPLFFLAQKFPAQLVNQGGQNMGTMNKVILIGRLGKDPEERTTAGGTRISNFSLATDVYHGGNGEKTTEWHRIIGFGKIAEQCNQYLKKGRLVCVEGSLQTRTWEKAPGEKHYFTDVVAARVTFLDSKGDVLSEQSAAVTETETPF
jgi:single-strand DNA-binding protein